MAGQLNDTGRVRAPRVTVSRDSLRVAFVVKGVDDIEAAYVALAYVDSGAAQIPALHLANLAYKSVTPYLPSSADESEL